MTIDDINTTKMISAHEIRIGLTVERPTVLPRVFWIPSVNEDSNVIKERCVTFVREVADRESVRIKYAKVWRKGPHPVVLLTIPDVQFLKHGTEIQKVDEWGVPMYPEVSRAFLHQRAAKFAIDVEDEFKQYGVIRIKGDEPTDEEVETAFNLYRTYVVQRINEANAGYERFGMREITPQTLEMANVAFKNKWISALPKWGSLDLNPTDNPGVFACHLCGKPLRADAVKCGDCGAIYNWKTAFEYGLVKAIDVPPTKRKEAGLPETETIPAGA